MPPDPDPSGIGSPGSPGTKPARTPAGRPPDAAGDVHELVDDIRSYLEQTTARDAELLRREQELKGRLADVAQRELALSMARPAEPHIFGIAAAPDMGRARRRRVLFVAATVGIATGIAWFIARAAPCRAIARIVLDTTNPHAAEATATHRAALLDPLLLRTDPNAGGLAVLWQAACDDGRVAAWTTSDATALHLSVIMPRAADARRLLQTAVEAYGRRLEQASNTGQAPGYSDLDARRESLRAALESLQQQQAEDQALLATTPDAPQHEHVSAVADGLEADLARIATALDDTRTELAVSVAAEQPRGTVTPAEIAATLTDDAVYQEDRKELLAAAAQYRTELAVAWFGVSAPVRAVEQKLTQLRAAADEQRGLDPPAEIRTLLDGCAGVLEPLSSRLAPFAEGWQQRLDALQTRTVGDDPLELVKLQATAADAAQGLADEAAALVGDLGARVEALASAAGGGTRAVVVAALLRSEHGAFKTSVDNLAAVARRTALPGNIDLDALDRRLRGLRGRLNGREQTVTQQLQLDADRTTQAGHTAHVEELRVQVRDLERRREDVVSKLMAALQQLRALDETLRPRAEVQARLEQREAETAWLTARLETVEQELATLLARRSQPDHLVLGAPLLTTVGPSGLVSALVGALVAFGATLIIAAALRPVP